ncbi:MAG: thiosulfate/3-mercaptopyruvate sulfurtransferase [Gaiellaceae bacterium]|jgi:thiosulfate/3-mercaptopyruvate sulfurtransferase|nr:thiosulfate/3-mercaptopyruvate sulfurtransferase [Gaiellaceae bacterium]MDX6388594.1 thiosulfate/3-mercaptopyruvate sulfurtransferase [Gaiellaceae bacterium]MDX6436799.1 thiosulfate/3-mercaptopyruvate sulfurtransferase [Gaiellaceae bacterium]
MSELPSVVDSAWLEGELGAADLVIGDVRGPNAHARGHIAGSRPLVLGSPPPMSDPEMLAALAPEVGLRLRRHGVTGEERLVLYDRGDGVGAMPAAQMAELAGHPRVAVLLGGIGAWPGQLEVGQIELHPVKTTFEPRFEAIPTRDELAGRLGDAALMIIDVRSAEEFAGKRGYPCDPRQGRIPGARHVPVEELFAGPGQPLPADQIRARLGDPEEVVAYCHSGSRSALATLALRAAGFRARNYAGSWHEWSRHDELPLEKS